MYKKYLKRPLDTFLAICGVIVLGIPMLIIGILVKLDSEGPVLFKQKRLGKNLQPFTVYKFRTMCNHAYEIGGLVKCSNDSRITDIGEKLRRTSLDELPQFFNIIKGDMAIIGPRPILDWEFEDYKSNSQYMTRYNVLPGMFCTVDLDFRAEADRDLQFTMDAEYVKSITFIKDYRIFFGILKTVISGKNVYKEEVGGR